MPYRGSKRKKRRTFNAEDESIATAPKSFIFPRAGCGPSVKKLVLDLRKVFQPYTAMRLKIHKKNSVKDVLKASKPLGVTHWQMLTCADSGTYLRLMRLPTGPCIQLRIESFELMKDVAKEVRRPREDKLAYMNYALPVLNNFSTSNKRHMELFQTMTTSLFPELRVDTVKLSGCKRVILFHLNKETELIDIRHYNIVGFRSGANKAVKKMEKKRLPKRLNQLKDIAELVGREDAYFSDSDGEAEEVMLPDTFRGMAADTKSLIKLVETGPRLTVSINKIVDGFQDGEVLYHSTITKTEEEVEELRRKRKKRDTERKERKDVQETNVARKKAIADEKKEKKEAKKKKARGEDTEEGAQGEGDDDEDDDEEGADDCTGEGGNIFNAEEDEMVKDMMKEHQGSGSDVESFTTGTTAHSKKKTRKRGSGIEKKERLRKLRALESMEAPDSMFAGGRDGVIARGKRGLDDDHDDDGGDSDDGGSRLPSQQAQNKGSKKSSKKSKEYFQKLKRRRTK